MQKTRKITQTLANGYSSESTRQELSNEYQDDRVSMVFQESCILVLWTKVVSALEGLNMCNKHIFELNLYPCIPGSTEMQLTSPALLLCLFREFYLYISG